MTDERLKEIKDSIDLQLEVAKVMGLSHVLKEEKELYEYVEELKKKLKKKDEGFKAVNEELREYAEENEKLKKQLEEIMTGKRPIISPYHGDAYITHEMEYQERKRLEKQQQEFINWLKRKLFILSDEMTKLAIGMCNTDYQKTKQEIYQEILQKYKKIIGGNKDEK